ncbi:hypothetical protein [Mucilaginibacter sp. HD30]
MREYQKVNKKYAILVFIVFVIVCILMLVDTIIRVREGARKYLNMDFAGTVDRVEYDIKQFPTITLKGKIYYIGSGYNTDHQIEIGDSLIKKKGSMVYKLIKHNTGSVILFKR